MSCSVVQLACFNSNQQGWSNLALYHEQVRFHLHVVGWLIWCSLAVAVSSLAALVVSAGIFIAAVITAFWPALLLFLFITLVGWASVQAAISSLWLHYSFSQHRLFATSAAELLWMDHSSFHCSIWSRSVAAMASCFVFKHYVATLARYLWQVEWYYWEQQSCRNLVEL